MLANDLLFYIDNGRPSAFSGKEDWSVLCSIGSMLSLLEVQKANRKSTTPSKSLGEWTGTPVDSSNRNTTVLESYKKWKRGHGIISRIQKEQKENGDLDYKSLERDQGFLIYLSHTYYMMSPYLKSIHQTLNSWRKGRDKDG